MWGKGKKSGVATSKSSHSTEPSGVVVSHVAPSSFSKAKTFLKGKRARYGIVVLLLVAIGAAGFAAWQNRQDAKQEIKPEDPPYTVTDEEFAKVKVASLRQQKPASNASAEDKKLYYDELITNEFTATNYKAAADVYDEALRVVGESNLSFNTYITGARSYARLGDKSKADSIFTLAEQTVKASTYFDEVAKKDFLDTITYFREEAK